MESVTDTGKLKMNKTVRSLGQSQTNREYVNLLIDFSQALTC